MEIFYKQPAWSFVCVSKKQLQAGNARLARKFFTTYAAT